MAIMAKATDHAPASRGDSRRLRAIAYVNAPMAIAKPTQTHHADLGPKSNGQFVSASFERIER
jgi:hypothetical protein